MYHYRLLIALLYILFICARLLSKLECYKKSIFSITLIKHSKKRKRKQVHVPLNNKNQLGYIQKYAYFKYVVINDKTVLLDMSKDHRQFKQKPTKLTLHCCFSEKNNFSQNFVNVNICKNKLISKRKY